MLASKRECHQNQANQPSTLLANLESGDPSYLVHYKGWNSRYDENVKHSQSAGKIFEATPESIADAKHQYKEQKKNKKGRVENVNDDKSDNGSRASSPGAFGAEKPTFDTNVSLPKPLRAILIDDRDLINKNYLTKVPARFTVDQIIEDYRATLGKNKDDATVDEFYVEYENGSSLFAADSMILSARGVADYFNNLLELQLLYKFEQPQFQELVEKEKNAGKPVAKKSRKSAAAAAKESSPSNSNADDEFRPSKYYGLVHLLRLLMHLPNLLKLSPWNDYVLKGITQTIHDFVLPQQIIIVSLIKPKHDTQKLNLMIRNISKEF
ncbi:unnamed protein product [Caenorhabditis angaria]|uniref:MRG domain-containing protein n=1 Tax=Caenorhabditis angaria TaxID=860376 RepID=A0A9P1IL45_9PELO|nr:unnamed protein product [Caenorhabditis angaria]